MKRIRAIHFLPNGTDAVVLFDDCKFGRAKGDTVQKWRRSVEAMVDGQRDGSSMTEVAKVIHDVLTGDSE